MVMMELRYIVIHHSPLMINFKYVFKKKFQALQVYLQNNGGQHILEEYEKHDGILSDRTRRELVNLTVKMMIQIYGTNLSKKIKVDFAKSIVGLFPKLKDPTSTKGGYVSVFFNAVIIKSFE